MGDGVAYRREVLEVDEAGGEAFAVALGGGVGHVVCGLFCVNVVV